MYLYVRMFAHIYTAALFLIVFSFVHVMRGSFVYFIIYLYILYDIYIHTYIYIYLTNDILYVYILYILIPSKPHDFEATRKPQKREAAERVQILSPGESGQYFRTKIRQTAGSPFGGRKIWVVATQIFFYFHPENWGRFPFWLIFLKGVETTTKRPWL